MITLITHPSFTFQRIQWVLACLPEFVANHQSLSSQPESQEMEDVEAKVLKETPLHGTQPKAKFNSASGEKKSVWSRYSHKARASSKGRCLNTLLQPWLFAISFCFTVLPIILFSPRHKVPCQAFHSKPTVKRFWPLEMDGLVFGVPQSAITNTSFK